MKFIFSYRSFGIDRVAVGEFASVVDLYDYAREYKWTLYLIKEITHAEFLSARLKGFDVHPRTDDGPEGEDGPWAEGWEDRAGAKQDALQMIDSAIKKPEPFVRESLAQPEKKPRRLHWTKITAVFLVTIAFAFLSIILRDMVQHIIIPFFKP